MEKLPPLSASTALPPKRKSFNGTNADSMQKQTSEDSFIQDEVNEIDPELLAEFEQAVKETGNEVIVDLSIQPKENTITAPILEDYIDPHTVPLQYLLEQAHTELKPEELSEDFSNTEAEEHEREE